MSSIALALGQGEVRAQVNQVTFDVSNSTASVMSLGDSTLTLLSELSDSGSNDFNVVTGQLRFSSSGDVTLGIESADFDAVMFAGTGTFNADSPGTGALELNDDTSVSAHQSIVGSDAIIGCGNVPSYCPQITLSNVNTTDDYFVSISTYNPNVSTPVPLNFYTSRPFTATLSSGVTAIGEGTANSPTVLSGSTPVGTNADGGFAAYTLSSSDITQSLQTNALTINNSSTIYVGESDTTPNTLTIASNNSSSDLIVGNGSTLTVVVGQTDGAGTPGNDGNNANLVIAAEVNTNSTGVVNITTSSAGTDTVTFRADTATEATSIDLGTGSLTLIGTNDTATFTGSQSQIFTGRIAAGGNNRGMVVVNNTVGSGTAVTFSGAIGTGTNRLGGLTLTAGSTAFAGDVFTGAITRTAGLADFDGDVTASSISLNGTGGLLLREM